MARSAADRAIFRPVCEFIFALQAYISLLQHDHLLLRKEINYEAGNRRSQQADEPKFQSADLLTAAEMVH